MSKKARISARVDEDVKNKAEQIFEQMGLSTSAAVSMFMNQVVRERGFPFRPHLEPNETTRQSMKRTVEGEEIVYEDEDRMFDELGMS